MVIHSQFRKLKMKSQIIILDIAILLLVLGVCTIAIYVEAKIFNEISSESSRIMMNSTDIKLIDNIGNQVESYLVTKHQRSKQYINEGIQLGNNFASFLYHYDNNQHQQNFNDILELCLTEDQQKYDQYINNTPKFCYQTHGDQQQQMLQYDNIKLLYYGLKEIEQYSLLFNLQLPNFLQVVDTSSIIFDALYPKGLLVNDYNPQQRPWYINHMTQINNTKNEFFFFTNVYQILYSNQVYSFSITQSLFNKNKEFFGILKSLLFVTDPNLYKIQFNVLLINSEGQVMQNGMENQTNNVGVLYIYNETITGFNVTDWEEIELKANQERFLQNQNNQDSMLILYNKIYQQFVNLKCKKFRKENFTLILFTNYTQQYILEQKILDRQQELLLQYGFAILLIFCVAIMLFCLSVIFINLICNPIVKLRQKIQYHVKEIGNNTDKMIFKITSRKKNKQDLIIKLNEMFMNISETVKLNSNKKSEQCRLIERMQYHKRSIKESFQNQNQHIPSLNDLQLNSIDLNEFNKEILKLLMNCTNQQQ